MDGFFPDMNAPSVDICQCDDIELVYTNGAFGTPCVSGKHQLLNLNVHALLQFITCEFVHLYHVGVTNLYLRQIRGALLAIQVK